MMKTCLPRLFLVHLAHIAHIVVAIIQFVFSCWIVIVVAAIVAVNFPGVTATFCCYCFFSFCLSSSQPSWKSICIRKVWQYMHSGHTFTVYEFKIHPGKVWFAIDDSTNSSDGGDSDSNGDASGGGSNGSISGIRAAFMEPLKNTHPLSTHPHAHTHYQTNY